jgi:hypothetical protein
LFLKRKKNCSQLSGFARIDLMFNILHARMQNLSISNLRPKGTGSKRLDTNNAAGHTAAFINNSLVNMFCNSLQLGSHATTTHPSHPSMANIHHFSSFNKKQRTSIVEPSRMWPIPASQFDCPEPMEVDDFPEPMEVDDCLDDEFAMEIDE